MEWGRARVIKINQLARPDQTVQISEI